MYKSLVFKFLTESEVSSVPVGYQFTTDKGTEFYKSSSGWKNSLSDKSVAPKMAERLESAALSDIDTINASSEFKIGNSYTDTEGNIYFYTGDDFVTVDGQSLSPDEADDAMKAVRVVADAPAPDNANGDPKTDEPDAVPSEDKPVDKSPVEPSDEPTKSEPVPDEPTKSEPVPVKPTNKQASAKPAPAPSSEPAKSDPPTDDAINKLAKLIKRHPRMLRLRKLIMNGDPLSLLAADIILSGKDVKLKAEILTRLGEKK